MGRLIDADRLKAHYCWWAGGSKEMSIDEAKKTFDTIIDIQPTVDAVEVVRCIDCKHSDWWGPEGKETLDCIHLDVPCVTPDWYCAWGERRR